MARPVKLATVRSEKRHSEAKAMRSEMYHHIGSAVRDAGDDIAGYALVIWDREGYNWSSLRSGGPVKSRLVSAFVGDALNQHVTCDLVAQDERK